MVWETCDDSAESTHNDANCDWRGPVVVEHGEWDLLDLARGLVCFALLALYGMGVDG